MSFELWESLVISLIVAGFSALITIIVLLSNIKTQLKIHKENIQHEINLLREDKILEKRMEKAEAIIIDLLDATDILVNRWSLTIAGRNQVAFINEKGVKNLTKEDLIITVEIYSQLIDNFNVENMIADYEKNPLIAESNLLSMARLTLEKSMDQIRANRRKAWGGMIYFTTKKLKYIDEKYDEHNNIVDNVDITTISNEELLLIERDLRKINSQVASELRKIIGTNK